MLTLYSYGSASLAADQPEQRMGEIVVTEEKSAVPANVPATTEAVTATQIRENINAVTSAEVLQYLPSVHVRERFIGDRNGILVMRVNSSISSAQTTIYLDDLLISNFLNNSFSTPPRWGMVSPEEIERVDVIYGPFSAFYPGNSAGGVVLITTRMPQKLEAHASADAFSQHFKLYGTDDRFNGWHATASAGNKVGDFSFWLGEDHLDSHGQPQTFGAAVVKAPPAPAPANVTPISDGFRDIDPNGAPRVINSSIGADHNVQDNGKFKLAYDFSPTVRASYILGFWQNTTDTSVASYVTDAAGRAVYNTPSGKFVQFPNDPNFYSLTGTSPGHSESEHWMHGLSLKSNTGGRWDWEAVASYYDENRDITRTATNTGSLYDSGTGPIRPGGTITVANGTGWRNLDLRGEWRPGGDLRSEHQVSVGYHYDRYILVSDTYSIASDWLNADPGMLTSNSRGKTETQALYLQDAWRYAPNWELVAGGRLEHWRAFDGSNFGSTNVPPTPPNVVYAERTDTSFSPKLSLSFAASPLWTLRGSLGKAYRYPTVAEIFQVINLPNNVRTNDPNLKPENVLSWELTAERALPLGIWRTSVFGENKRDALISQTDTTTIPGTTISSIQNVDKIRTTGVETALQISDLWIRGFDLSGSITYVDSKIVKDDRNPFVVGKPQPRIPDWRATVVAAYRPSDNLVFTVAGRFSGRQHVNLLYTDINPNVYGTTVSKYQVWDAKLYYKISPQWSASFGIDNIFSYKYYVNPNPYPQRTLIASVKFDY